MILTVVARFHAATDKASAMAAAIIAVAAETAKEPDCLGIETYRSIRDTGLFHLQSRWVNEPAFDRRATLAHTVAFIRAIEGLADQPFEVSRARPLRSSEPS